MPTFLHDPLIFLAQRVVYPSNCESRANTHYIVTIEREEILGTQDLWNVLGNLTGKVECPEDWSQEHDHYLYGTPKRGKG